MQPKLSHKEPSRGRKIYIRNKSSKSAEHLDLATLLLCQCVQPLDTETPCLLSDSHEQICSRRHPKGFQYNPDVNIVHRVTRVLTIKHPASQTLHIETSRSQVAAWYTYPRGIRMVKILCVS